MKKTTITLSGPTGSGKTTLLHLIGAHLQSLNIPVSCCDETESRPVEFSIADLEAKNFRIRRENNPVFIQTFLVEQEGSQLTDNQQTLIDQSIASMTTQLVAADVNEDEIDARVDLLRGLLNQYFAEAQ